MISFRWKKPNMKSFSWLAATVAALVALEGAPAGAGIIHNGLSNNGLSNNALVPNAHAPNALTTGGSALDDLNGVAVEAAAPAEAQAGATDGVLGDPRHSSIVAWGGGVGD